MPLVFPDVAADNTVSCFEPNALFGLSSPLCTIFKQTQLSRAGLLPKRGKDLRPKLHDPVLNTHLWSNFRAARRFHHFSTSPLRSAQHQRSGLPHPRCVTHRSMGRHHRMPHLGQGFAPHPSRCQHTLCSLHGRVPHPARCPRTPPRRVPLSLRLDLRQQHHHLRHSRVHAKRSLPGLHHFTHNVAIDEPVKFGLAS